MYLEHEETTRDYLMRSSQGQKFEYVDLKIDDDGGPFGDERYTGVAWLPEVEEISEQEASLFELTQDWAVVEQLMIQQGHAPSPQPLELVFINREENELRGGSSFTWANLLLLVTPRDPKGPFTISVYQDFTLCGWLVGVDAEPIAIDLVEKYDFGTAVIAADRLEYSQGTTKFRYTIASDYSDIVDIHMPNQITSPTRVPPSKLTWSAKPNYIELPRNVSWDGPGELLVDVLNEDASELLEGEDLLYVRDGRIALIPDIWNEETKAMHVYIDDTYIGRVTDREKEIAIFEATSGQEPKIALSRTCFLFPDDGRLGCSLDADIRPIIRIDWNVVEGQI